VGNFISQIADDIKNEEIKLSIILENHEIQKLKKFSKSVTDTEALYYIQDTTDILKTIYLSKGNNYQRVDSYFLIFSLFFIIVVSLNKLFAKSTLK